MKQAKTRNTDIAIGGYPEGTDTFKLNQPKSLACYEYTTNIIRLDNWGLEINRKLVEGGDSYEKILPILHHEMLHQAIYKVEGVGTSHLMHKLNIKYKANVWQLV